MNKKVEQAIKLKLSDLSGTPLREIEKAIESKSRMRDLMIIRHSFRYLMRKHTDCSLKLVGMKSGMADHSTVVNSMHEVEDKLSIPVTNKDNRFYRWCDQLTFDNLITEKQ